jgi:hypothetical protein
LEAKPPSGNSPLIGMFTAPAPSGAGVILFGRRISFIQ